MSSCDCHPWTLQLHEPLSALKKNRTRAGLSWVLPLATKRDPTKTQETFFSLMKYLAYYTQTFNFFLSNICSRYEGFIWTFKQLCSFFIKKTIFFWKRRQNKCWLKWRLVGEKIHGLLFWSCHKITLRCLVQLLLHLVPWPLNPKAPLCFCSTCSFVTAESLNIFLSLLSFLSLFRRWSYRFAVSLANS